VQFVGFTISNVKTTKGRKFSRQNRSGGNFEQVFFSVSSAFR